MIETINVREVIPQSNIAQMRPVSEMKPAEGQSDVWDFDVSPVPLYADFNGRKSPSNIFGIVRHDTGEVIGRYQREGSLLPNVELVGRFEDALTQRGATFDRSITTFDNGARMLARYTLDKELSILGDNCRREITIRNSYDSTWTVASTGGVKRMICLNGMFGFEQFESLMQKHSPKLDLDLIFRQIDHVLEFDPSKDLERLADRALTHEQAANMLGNVARYSKNAISKNAATRILLNWHQPDETERNLGDNAWRLYNAGTRFFRDLATVRAERSNDASFMFTNIMTLAASGRKPFGERALDTLLVEPEKSFRLLDKDIVTVSA